MKKLVFVMLFCFTQLAFSKSFITYNAAVAHTFVPLAKERLPKVIEALKKEQADVVCLQEVWTKKDRKKVLKELKDIYPYNFTTKIKQTRSAKKPTCKKSDLFGDDRFITCTLEKCKNKNGDDFTSCLINKCQNELTNLKNENKECAQGLMAQVGKSTIRALANVFSPFVGAGLYTYKGSNGLILLSKKEMKNKKLIDMSSISSLTRRQALSAEVENTQVICTHLSANLTKTAPYAGKFNNWEEENFAQVNYILSKQEREKIVLLGDFNCGLEDNFFGLSASFENSCKQVMDAGFYDYFIDENPSCTYCEDNTLNDGSVDVMIDHVFVKNLQVKKGHYIFKNRVDVKGKQVSLSDHFGMKLELE